MRYVIKPENIDLNAVRSCLVRQEERPSQPRMRSFAPNGLEQLDRCIDTLERIVRENAFIGRAKKNPGST